MPIGSFCKDGEWIPERDSCVINRPALAGLLATSPSWLQAWFWFNLLGGVLMIRLILYIGYTCLALAYVERNIHTDTTCPTNRRDAAQDQDIVLQTRDRDSVWVPAFRLPEAARRSKWKRIYDFTKSTWQASSQALLSCFLWDPTDERLVTRDLTTYLHQVQYQSGNTLWIFRGLGSHLVWWEVVRPLLIMGVFIFSVILVGIAAIIMIVLGKLLKFKVPKWPPSYAFILVANLWTANMVPFDRRYRTLLPRGLNFCMLRLLSRATGFKRNEIEVNFHDTKLFNPQSNVTWAPAMLYSTIHVLTNLIPYLMISDLELQSGKYMVDEMGVIHKDNLILSNNNKMRSLIQSYIVWMIFRLFLLTPCFIWMTFNQCQALNHDEKTIVRFGRIDGWHQMVFHQKVTVVFRTIAWRRIFRLYFQITSIGMTVGAVLFGSMSMCLRRMEGRDFILDWILREYLDFGLVVEISGIWRGLFFWLNWRKLWYDNRSW